MFPRMCIHEPCRNMDVKMCADLPTRIREAHEPLAHREARPGRDAQRQLAGDEAEVADGPRQGHGHARALDEEPHAPTFSAISTNVA